MLSITIPGFGALCLAHLVLDYNGTIAEDGELIPGVQNRLSTLSQKLSIHVLTADTFGTVEEKLSGAPVKLHILGEGKQDEMKLDYVRSLDSSSVVSVGNGGNDRLMLEASGLGLSVLQTEGAAAGTLFASDAVCRSICDALDLLIHPLRLTATLRY